MKIAVSYTQYGTVRVLRNFTLHTLTQPPSGRDVSFMMLSLISASTLTRPRKPCHSLLAYRQISFGDISLVSVSVPAARFYIMIMSCIRTSQLRTPCTSRMRPLPLHASLLFAGISAQWDGTFHSIRLSIRPSSAHDTARALHTNRLHYVFIR